MRRREECWGLGAGGGEEEKEEACRRAVRGEGGGESE